MHRGRQTHPRRELLLTAAALYIACVMNKENRAQKVLTEAADVTDVAIRNRYTELKRVLHLDISVVKMLD
jgi:transcription initiation factor TFIIIB Brf1 subunit/transcription initiation factor TFIIB